MHSKFVLFLFLLLAACETPKLEVRIQKVYCITPEQYAQLVKAEPAKIGNNLQANPTSQLVTQNVLVRQYADGLLTVLGGCTAPAP